MEKSKFTWQEGESPQIFHWYHLKGGKSPLKDGESLTGATTDPQNPSTAGMNKPND